MSGDLAAFLLARIAEDEQRGGRSREHPRDVDCPCGKRGTLDTLTFNGREQSAEIVHVVGWAPPFGVWREVLGRRVGHRDARTVRRADVGAGAVLAAES